MKLGANCLKKYSTQTIV